jgi:hypothetical protein
MPALRVMGVLKIRSYPPGGKSEKSRTGPAYTSPEGSRRITITGGFGR